MKTPQPFTPSAPIAPIAPFVEESEDPTLRMQISAEVLESLRDSERSLKVSSERAVKVARKCRK